MNERLQELAALQAAGAIDPAELLELRALLAQGDPESRREDMAFQRLSAMIVSALPPQTPPAGLKEKLLRKLDERTAAPMPFQPVKVPPGFKFIRANEGGEWQPLPVAGAWVKMLSFDESSGYAVVLGKLDPGARYPRHTHIAAEQIFVLSGDLHIGDTALQAGDFHHADAGTEHDVNFSETGCVILAVLSTRDLMAQYAAGNKSS